MSQSAGVSSERVERIDISPFWKKNEPLLKELERLEMTPGSRLVYKETTTTTTTSTTDDSGGGNNNNNVIMTSYDVVNIYGNRKNFFGIVAEIAPDRSLVIREEIVAGSKLSDAKKTTVDGSRISSKAHIDWLMAMSQNDASRLFRT